MFSRACAVAALKDVCDYFTRELGQVVVSDEEPGNRMNVVIMD